MCVLSCYFFVVRQLRSSLPARQVDFRIQRVGRNLRNIQKAFELLGMTDWCRVEYVLSYILFNDNIIVNLISYIIYNINNSKSSWDASLGKNADGSFKDLPTLERFRGEQTAPTPNISQDMITRHYCDAYMGMGQDLLLPYLWQSTSISQLF